MASTILFSLNQTYLYEKNYLLLCLLYATKIRPASVNAGQGTLKNLRIYSPLFEKRGPVKLYITHKKRMTSAILFSPNQNYLYEKSTYYFAYCMLQRYTALPLTAFNEC